MDDLNNKCTPKELEIDKIKTEDNRRALNNDKVEELMKSISTLGLQTPITVRKRSIWGSVRYVLIAGLHRLEALKRLGAETITCHVIKCDDHEARLWEIAENLHRADLTALESAQQLAEWARLIEEEDEAGEDDNEAGRHGADDGEEGNAFSGKNVRKKRRGRPEGGLSKVVGRLPVKGRSREARRKTLSRARLVAAIAPEAKEIAKKAGLDRHPSALDKIAAGKTKDDQVAKARELAAHEAEKEKRRGGFGKARGKHRGQLSEAEKRALQRLLGLWKKHLEAPFAKAPQTVRKTFVARIKRVSSPDGMSNVSSWEAA